PTSRSPPATHRPATSPASTSPRAAASLSPALRLISLSRPRRRRELAEDLGYGFVEGFGDGVADFELDEGPGEGHVSHDRDAPLLGGAGDAGGQVALAARDHDGGFVAALLVVAEGAGEVRRVDHDDARRPDARDRGLRHELLVGALARGSNLRIALGLSVVTPHFVSGHPEPPQPRAPRDECIRQAEREPDERRVPQEASCHGG